MATLRFASDFEAAGFPDWDSETDPSSKLASGVTTQVYHNAAACEMISNSAATYQAQKAITGTTDSYVSLWMYTPAPGGATAGSLLNYFHDLVVGLTYDFILRPKAGLAAWQLYVDAFGATIGYVDAWSSAGWHHIEVQAIKNTANGLKLWADGSLLGQTNTPNLGNPLTSFAIGDPYGSWPIGVTVYVDALEVWDGGIPTSSHFGRARLAAAGGAMGRGKDAVRLGAASLGG